MPRELNEKKIIIFQQRGWAKNVGYYLAENLHKEGCQLAALTLKKLAHRIITRQESAKYEYIINIDDIFDNPKKYLGNEKITLEEICKELNIDSVWPMLYSNRLFSRSYKDKFYYSYKQNVSDEFIITYVKAYYKVIRDLFINFKPDAVFTAAFVYEGHTILNLFANKYNIPIVSITDSRIPGYYVFTNDYLDRKSPLVDRFNELNNGSACSNNIEKAKKFIEEFRKKLVQPDYAVDQNKKISIFKKIKSELSPFKRMLEWYTKNSTSENYIKSVGATIDYKPPKIILRDHFCQKKYLKYAKNFKYYSIDKIDKFIFYPLQFTPEGSADLRCPLYNNQLEIARQISMSLPDDYTLVVKEHPGMVGLRSPSYYDKISNTLNIKLIDYKISSEEILKKTSMVISSYGTALFEAAFYWKPAIILSEAKLFTLLPNVFKHTDISTLSKKIKELLVINLKTNEYEKQLENYISAVFDVGFSVNYRKIWYEGESKTREQLIDLFINEINKKINEI